MPYVKRCALELVFFREQLKVCYWGWSNVSTSGVIGYWIIYNNIVSINGRQPARLLPYIITLWISMDISLLVCSCPLKLVSFARRYEGLIAAPNLSNIWAGWSWPPKTWLWSESCDLVILTFRCRILESHPDRGDVWRAISASIYPMHSWVLMIFVSYTPIKTWRKKNSEVKNIFRATAIACKH